MGGWVSGEVYLGDFPSLRGLRWVRCVGLRTDMAVRNIEMPRANDAQATPLLFAPYLPPPVWFAF